MALTSDQLSDFQADLAISTDQSVFTDAELNRLYSRAGDDYDTAVYLAWRQLMARGAKYHKYTEGHTTVEKQQVFDHIKEMVTYWYETALTGGNSQVILAGLNEIPTRHKETPGEVGARLSRKQLNRGIW